MDIIYPNQHNLEKHSSNFDSPKIDKKMLKAITSISPHIKLEPYNEQDRLFWVNDQNKSCDGEYEVLKKHIHKFNIRKTLEIGPGMGRSIVFFSKLFPNSRIWSYEGDGDQKKYSINGKRTNNSFCGNIEILKKIIKFNEIQNHETINEKSCSLKEISNSFDFIYSFYAVGYHWDLSEFWEDIVTLMNPISIAAFTVPNWYVIENKPGFQQFLHDWKSHNSPKTKILIIEKNLLI